MRGQIADEKVRQPLACIPGIFLLGLERGNGIAALVMAAILNDLAWLDFFLTGVADTADQAFDAATRIVELFKQDRERITVESDRAGSALRIHDLFQQNPYLTANQLVQQTELSAPTINAALADLERFGIVEEVTGRKRGRYRGCLAILSEGTDPLPTAA